MENQAVSNKIYKRIEMPEFTITMKMDKKGGIEGFFHKNHGRDNDYELLNGLFVSVGSEISLSFDVIWFRSHSFVASTIFSGQICEGIDSDEVIYISWALIYEDLSNRNFFVKTGECSNSDKHSTSICYPFPKVAAPFDLIC